MLSSLVSKSLVVRQDEGSQQARFRLLQLIRQYARSRFALHPDRVVTHRRHARYYRDLVERAAPRSDWSRSTRMAVDHRPRGRQHPPGDHMVDPT